MNDMQKMAESFEGVKKYVGFLKEQGYTVKKISWIKLSNAKSRLGMVSGGNMYDFESRWLSWFRHVSFSRFIFVDREVFHSTAAHEAIHCMKENTDKHRKSFMEMAKKLNDEFNFEFPVDTHASNEEMLRIQECEKTDKLWVSKYKYAVRCKRCSCYVLFYEELPTDFVFDKTYTTHSDCPGPVEVIDIQNMENTVKQIPVCIE